MIEKIVKPPKLSKGSKIAVISPSWGGPSIFPKILDKAVENIINIFEFEVIEFSTSRMDAKQLYENPILRAEDINEAFKDKTIDAIFVSIGGDDSIRILEHLDTEVIMNNPKIIMGFSDTTTILTYLNTLGLVTFHGPTMMAGWAQIHNFKELNGYYKDTLMNSSINKELPIPGTWSNGYPDWSIEETVGDVNDLKVNPGLRWLQGTEAAEGRTWGGCIEVLDMINGTRFWPSSDFWNNRILILEVAEGTTLPGQVGLWIRNYGVQGILNKISGLLIGRPKDYTEKQSLELDEVILNIINNEFGIKNIPIVSNMNFGHTDPNLIIPLGIKFQIDPKNRSIKIRENIFR
ncbi:MAG: LD-carboxypeptidase [Spirochaetaceae bacterium]